MRPGFTLTDMAQAGATDGAALARIGASIAMGRAALASEIAEPIVWLLTDAASFTSGAILDVSGGGYVIR